jgi:hypothetical protein
MSGLSLGGADFPAEVAAAISRGTLILEPFPHLVVPSAWTQCSQEVAVCARR